MAQRTTIVVIQIVCEIKCGEVQTDRVCSMGKMIRSMHLAQICDRQMKIWTWHGLNRFTCKDDLQNHLSQGPPSSYIYVAPAISKSHTPWQINLLREWNVNQPGTVHNLSPNASHVSHPGKDSSLANVEVNICRLSNGDPVSFLILTPVFLSTTHGDHGARSIFWWSII